MIVLFACVENSCRSQIAEAFAKKISPHKFDFYSAGSKPSGIINPLAIKLLKSQGVYLTDHRSKDVSEFINIKIDYLILMGCGDQCPNIVAEERVEWDIPDPKDMEAPEFLNVIEIIRGEVKKLIKTIDNGYSL